MREIIFYILSTALIIFILELPTKHKGGDHMQTSEATQEVELYQCSQEAWYKDLDPILVTVAESGEKKNGIVTEYFITEGEHTGKHILKSDCREIITLGRLSA